MPTRELLPPQRAQLLDIPLGMSKQMLDTLSENEMTNLEQEKKLRVQGQSNDFNTE